MQATSKVSRHWLSRKCDRLYLVAPWPLPRITRALHLTFYPLSSLVISWRWFNSNQVPPVGLAVLANCSDWLPTFCGRKFEYFDRWCLGERVVTFTWTVERLAVTWRHSLAWDLTQANSFDGRNVVSWTPAVSWVSVRRVCVGLVTWLWLVYLKDPTVAPLDGVLCCPSSRLPLRSSGVNSSGEIVNFFNWIRTLLLRVDLHLLEETRVLSPEGIACFRRLQRRHYKSTPVSDLYWTISFSFDFAMDSATSAGVIEFRSKILFLEFSAQMMKRPSNRRWWSTSFLVDLMKVYFETLYEAFHPSIQRSMSWSLRKLTGGCGEFQNFQCGCGCSFDLVSRNRSISNWMERVPRVFQRFGSVAWSLVEILFIFSRLFIWKAWY